MMENVSLLLFYFMCQRMGCSIRRRAINRRRRRMFLKAVFQWCVFLRTFTYVCSIRANERVYVFWALHTCTYAKGKLENSLYPTPDQRKLAIFTKNSNGNMNTSCCGCQGNSPKTRSGVLGTSQTKTWVVRAHSSRRSSVPLFERAFPYTQGYLLATSESRSPRDIQRETPFEMPSPPLSEWQLLCGVWQQVEVFGKSLPTSMSESQRALQ